MKTKIGLIGVGSISQKAYLPVYAALQGENEFIVSSRTIEKAESLRAQYGFAGAVEGVEALMKEGIQIAFIHNITSAHAKTCEALLNAGIHVFVDKPISENLVEVEKLFDLAKEQNVLFMAGFNRRYAPFTDKLKAVPEKNTLFISKNRVNDDHTADWVIYDLFIHPLDTALYLLDDDIIHTESKIIEKAGKLQRAMLTIDTATTTAVVSMNLKSGANTESFQVQAAGGTYQVENLSRLTAIENGTTTVTEFGDWTPTLEKRGFDLMVKNFIATVGKFISGEIVEWHKAETVLRQDKVGLSHELCEQMLRKHERHTI
jgi:virulence factor